MPWFAHGRQMAPVEQRSDAMFLVISPARVCLVAVIIVLSVGAALVAQQGPVAGMFVEDEKRAQMHALSFARLELPAKSGVVPLHVYLSAGDLARAFDRPEFRPEAAIVPTNTDLLIAAPFPMTQRVLVERVQKVPDVMRDLEEQVAARRKSKPLQIGVDAFIAQLPRRAGTPRSDGAFPRVVCLIATEFAKGGGIDRRELLTQDRVRKGIAACLAGLDDLAVRSVVMPLMGAASSGTQAKDELYEGQRVLKECRLVNAVAGIGLGIHDFSARHRNVREIGIVQWDQEIDAMFGVPRGSASTSRAQAAYRTYAEQIRLALGKGLAGEATTSSDVYGSCNATFNAR
jgi:hypothetical protein